MSTSVLKTDFARETGARSSRISPASNECYYSIMAFHRNLRDQILTLRLEGFAYREIATKLSCALSTVSYYCGQGQQEKTLKRSRSHVNRKRKYVQELKSGSKCADCGEKYPYWVLEFDHVKGVKVAGISRMIQYPKWSMEDIIAEIGKCEIVCGNCHKNRTHTRLLKTGSDTLDIESILDTEDKLAGG